MKAPMTRDVEQLFHGVSLNVCGDPTQQTRGSGEEADATALFAAHLEVGERRDRDDVELALLVGQLDELRLAVESGRDDLLDLGRSLRRLDVELTGAVGDTDANVHTRRLRDAGMDGLRGSPTAEPGGAFWLSVLPATVGA